MNSERDSAPATDSDGLTAADRDQLEAYGIGVAEARRQLALLRDPPPWTRLERAARIGDGIAPFPEGAEADRLEAAGRAAARAGKMIKFVPASGAASRLFAELKASVAQGGAGNDPVDARFESVRSRLPFDGGAERILKRYGTAPKALIPFHRYPGGEQRTALEEHLVEAAAVVDAGATAAVHLSVGEDHRQAFETVLRERLQSLEKRLGCRFDVSLSHQAPATDSLALDAFSRPFRIAEDPASPRLTRPGGHGALLGNLQSLADLGYELIAIKNIDNVQPESAQGPAVRTLRILAGMARELAAGSGTPSRVCGVVPTVDSAGGGPFWVRASSGEVTRQIVELSQIDTGDAGQAAIVGRSTHFNPVLMVCSALGEDGKPCRLADYVDHDASFVTQKSHGGRRLTALERPGLWNGSMAGWETRFVEVPKAVYTPVKTMFDLAGSEHHCEGGEE